MTFGLRAARLFDGHCLVNEPVVAVDGTTILAVGSDVPGNIDVEDLGEVILMPGLIDTHQHLCLNGSGPLEQQVADVSDAELLDRSRANARRALQAGITTIRDLGDRNFITLALRDEPDLPAILASGPPLTTPGGHCWFLGGVCDGRDELVKAVHERQRRGCEVVKIMVTGGAHTPTGLAMWDSQFSLDDVRAVVDTAHELGLPVAAHCHGIEGTYAAVEARVDTIEHCSFFTKTGRAEPDADLIAVIASSGIVVSATLGREVDLPIPPVVADNMPAIFDATRQLREAGTVIAAGTDAGIGPAKPHDILPRAATDLAAIGITGADLLATFTSVAAKACNVADRKGRLAAGFEADLVAVAGNAVTDAAALLDVRSVWRSGIRVR